MIPPSIGARDIAACADIAVLAREMDAALSGGVVDDMIVPPRWVGQRDDLAGAFLSMPAVSPGQGIYIDKVGAVCPREPGDARPMVHALVVAFSTRTGEPLAIVDGMALTAVKCAAVTALVTDYCARADARVLAIVGAGVQAWEQFRGVRAVREVACVRVHARDPLKRAAFARELRRADPHVDVVECDTVDAAVGPAAIIGTATGSREPLASFANLTPGAHVNCMGAHTTTAREVPHDVLRRSLVVVEDVDTAVAEAGEVHAAALSLRRLPFVERDELRRATTVFSSTGHASLDAMATAHVLRRYAASASSGHGVTDVPSS